MNTLPRGAAYFAAVTLCLLQGTARASQIYHDQKLKHLALNRTAVEQAPLVTTATIERGGELIKIDFKVAGTENKLKDFDVIRLDAGRYEDLNFGKARSVTVIGQTNATVLRGGKNPIIVNNTEFWDVMFFDAKFKSSGDEGIWAVGSDFEGEFSIVPANPNVPLKFALYTALCELSFSNLPEDSTADYGQSGRFVHFFSQRRSAVAPTLENLANYRFPRFGEKPSGPLFASFGKTLEKFSFLDESVKLDPMIGNELDVEALHAIIDAAPSEGLSQKSVAKALLARTLYFAHQFKKRKTDYNAEQFQSLMKAANEANQNGRKLTALALWGEADRLSAHSKLTEIRKLAEPVARTALPETGCRIGIDGIGSTKLALSFTKPLFDKYPALTSPGRCVVSVVADRKDLFRNSKTEVTNSRDTYQLTQAASKRFGDEARRAQEAIEKAQRAEELAAQARITAHTERMVSAAKKDEAGRLRIEGSGGNKTMSYGSGHWNGEASAQTTAQINQGGNDSARLKALAAAAQGVAPEDMEKFKTEIDSTRVENLSMKLNLRADANFGTEKKQITVPTIAFSAQRVCRLKNYGMHQVSCNIESLDESLEYTIGAKVSADILPKLEKLLAEKISKATTRVKTNLQGKTGAAFVEAALAASFISQDPSTAALFASEYQKASGVLRDPAAALVLSSAFAE